MAWTTPKTWAVNEVVTAANMNTHLRDNINWFPNDSPRCSAVRTGVQTIANATNVAIALNATDEYDVGPMHDTVTNNERLTVPSGGGGLYHVHANCVFDNNATGNRFLNIWKNGTGLTPGILVGVPGLSAANTYLAVGVYVQLAAADWVSAVVSQTSGASLGLTEGRLQARWVAF